MLAYSIYQQGLEVRSVGDNRWAERPAATQKTAVALQMALLVFMWKLILTCPHTHTSQLALNTQEHSIIPPSFEHIDSVYMCV